MKTLYLDCFAGLAGDMLIGALFELAPDLERFRAELAKMTSLGPEDYELSVSKETRGGISGTNFTVHTHEHHPHRGLHDLERIVRESGLSDRVKREAIRAFALLADAEARVHGTTPDKIHFHEVGAIDSIIDIVGAFVFMELLGWPRVLSSPLNVGSGTVNCAHGLLPVPAPATELLLRGLPICSMGTPMERTTPTGALLARTLVDAFCPLPAGKIVASGYGLGDRDSEDIPNVLRVLLMDAGSGDGLRQEQVTLLECNIDDMNPQDFEPVCERLFGIGALDVWLEPIYMKKGRPAVRFCCLFVPEKQEAAAELILKETTTQGVRRLTMDRTCLERRMESVETPLGSLRVKTALWEDRPLRRTPEYEDLKRAARERGLSMAEVRRIATEALSKV
ncbi:MAG: nickel pincer cofactor biosynthesis protein LarC [Fretibacterium sp.]|nr:nickel pincer cofactor biosynthesis protein LarC [Fretibacterium sp.]